MKNTDLRSRLRPEELARYEAVMKKYPDFDFSVQPCDPRRFSLVMEYMRLCRWDPDVQRLLALGGRGWMDVHLVVAAISRSRGDYKRQRLKELGEWVPICLTDELKPIAERVDPEGGYASLEKSLSDERHGREMAELKMQMLERQLSGELERADRAERRADEAFGFIRQLSEQLAEEGDKWRESVSQFLAAHPAPAEECLSERELERRERQEELRRNEASGHEAIFQILAAYVQPFIPDAEERLAYARKVHLSASLQEAVSSYTRDLLERGQISVQTVQDNKFAEAFHHLLPPSITDSISTIRSRLSDLATEWLNRKV